jgi:hypothetical protein
MLPRLHTPHRSMVSGSLLSMTPCSRWDDVRNLSSEILRGLQPLYYLKLCFAAEVITVDFCRIGFLIIMPKTAVTSKATSLQD